MDCVYVSEMHEPSGNRPIPTTFTHLICLTRYLPDSLLQKSRLSELHDFIQEAPTC